MEEYYENDENDDFQILEDVQQTEQIQFQKQLANTDENVCENANKKQIQEQSFDNYKCDFCGGKMFDDFDIRGQLICEQCGITKLNIGNYYDVNEAGFQSTEQRGRNIMNNDFMFFGKGRLARHARWMTVTHKERMLNQIFNFIQQICKLYGFQKSVEEEAKALYKHCSETMKKICEQQEKKYIYKLSLRQLIAIAAIYYSLKKSNMFMKINRFCDLYGHLKWKHSYNKKPPIVDTTLLNDDELVTHNIKQNSRNIVNDIDINYITPANLSKGYKQFIFLYTHNQQLQQNILETTTDMYVRKMCQDFNIFHHQNLFENSQNLSEKTMTLANQDKSVSYISKIARNIQRTNLLYMHQSQSIAIVCIYIYLNMFNMNYQVSMQHFFDLGLLTKSTFVNMKKRVNMRHIILFNDSLIDQFLEIENEIISS